MPADIAHARREHAAASIAGRRARDRKQAFRPADDDRERHAAEAAEIRREWFAAALENGRVEAVRIAANRLVSEGRPITAANLRIHGARGRDRQLLSIARDLALRGLVNLHGYNQGRDARLAAPTPADLALAVGRCIEDFDGAWRRLNRPPRPKETPCSCLAGNATSPSSSTADASS